MSQATSFKCSITRTTYAVVICFIHFATTPSTNLSIPLSLRDFPLPPPTFGGGRGTNQTTCTEVEYCEREKNPLSRASPTSSPCKTFALLRSTRGAMHIKRYIAIQTNIPYIPDRTQQGRALCKTSIVVYIGQMVPPLERLERREEPKAKGGEFVEAYVASEDAKNPL